MDSSTILPSVRASISTWARRLIAAFTVCACSWNRYKGQMSSVPPARSIRVGAEVLICFMSRGAQEQNWHAHCVAHLVHGRAVDDVREEPMTVRRHRDEIDVFLRCDLDDLSGRITHRQPRGHLEPCAGQLDRKSVV